MFKGSIIVLSTIKTEDTLNREMDIELSGAMWDKSVRYTSVLQKADKLIHFKVVYSLHHYKLRLQLLSLSRLSATDVTNLVLHCLLPFGPALLSQGPGRTFYKDFCNQKLDLPFFVV